MRILHTADWHLCDKLGRIDRTKDLESRVEVVAGLCDEHRIDVLLVAGDLFSEQAGVEQMTAALEHLHRAFAGFFARGGTALAVTGNHDHDRRIGLVRAGMRLAVPAPPAGGRLEAGRLYLLNGCHLGSLQDAAGFRVQFVLVPYPTLARYAEPTDRYQTKEEENRLLHGRVAAWISGVSRRAEFDVGSPTVLAAHLHVRGAEVHSLYKMTERDDVVFDPGLLPTAWAYAALGHVHKPQALNGIEHVRYSGALDRLDFGEREHERGAVLIDVGPAGLCAEPRWLPIEPTPFHDLTLDDPGGELPSLAGRYPDRDRALVRVTARPGVMSRDEVGRALRGLFPRLAGLTWADQEKPTSPKGATAAFTPRSDHASTVRDYLREKLKDDPDRDAVLSLADRYLDEGGGA
jgi:exonuclease SbcD